MSKKEYLEFKQKNTVRDDVIPCQPAPPKPSELDDVAAVAAVAAVVAVASVVSVASPIVDNEDLSVSDPKPVNQHIHDPTPTCRGMVTLDPLSE